MRKKLESSTHGGKRPGAGRPPSIAAAAKVLGVRLPETLYAWVMTVGGSKFVRHLVEDAHPDPELAAIGEALATRSTDGSDTRDIAAIGAEMGLSSETIGKALVAYRRRLRAEAAIKAVRGKK